MTYGVTIRNWHLAGSYGAIWQQHKRVIAKVSIKAFNTGARISRESKETMNKADEMDKQKKKQQDEQSEGPKISDMKAVTRNAYGGGMYALEEADFNRPTSNPPAAETQSADGPGEAALQREPIKHRPPPSSGDRDIDITGQSYIQ